MNIPGPKKGYTDLLDEAITTRLKSEQAQLAKKYHPLRPSSAGQCSRKLALKLREYRGMDSYEWPIPEPNIDRLFKLGHSVEYHALRNFQELTGYQQRYKQQVVTLFDLPRGGKGLETEICEGSLDYVLVSDEFKSIGDVKSKKDSFSKAFKTGWEDELAKLAEMKSTSVLSSSAFYINDLPEFIEEIGYNYLVDNLLQLNLYAMSPFIQARGIDHAWLYRYNKNDSRHMEIRFKPSQKMFDYVRDKFVWINKVVDDGGLPDECEFPLGTMKRAFCECNIVLGDPATDRKAWFQTFPKKRWPTDISKTKESVRLSEYFTEYLKVSSSADKQKELEIKITDLMNREKIAKVKLEDGQVFELKYLKSPRPHFDLRKSKL